ncbi:hypothetical protein SCP_0300170 [Sparassis crispa]|uniref:Uncharacterized protein n=1 Tax=Sparassis crispa TaxID=139825 RepID=A0A401GDP8_9APHY|nr:hypothetical protein SCP_0300170 [Sparassis crispa]GBE80302.1 hypothetical protein SCP_0300170 [Sparassis crispa]
MSQELAVQALILTEGQSEVQLIQTGSKPGLPQLHESQSTVMYDMLYLPNAKDCTVLVISGIDWTADKQRPRLFLGNVASRFKSIIKLQLIDCKFQGPGGQEAFVRSFPKLQTFSKPCEDTFEAVASEENSAH